MKAIIFCLIATAALCLTTSCEKEINKVSDKITDKAVPTETALKMMQQTWIVDSLRTFVFYKRPRANKTDSIEVYSDSLITNSSMTFFKFTDVAGKFVHDYKANGVTISDTNQYRPVYNGGSDPATVYSTVDLYFDKPCQCKGINFRITNLTDNKFRIYREECTGYSQSTDLWIRRTISLHR